MIAALSWVGGHARWILALGSLTALMLPQLAALVRPLLPWLVCLVLGLSLARVDLPDMARNAFRRRFLARMGIMIALMMPVTGALYLALARLAGLAEADVHALVILAAAPPIASAGGLAFILGFNARLAMETTIAASIMTPIVGPAMIALLVPEAAGISGIDLAIRLARMIAGGIALALVIRRLVGPGRIAANKGLFDGVSAIGMLMFIFPLFDGVLSTVMAAPGRALWVLALAALVNLGVNAGIRRLLVARSAEDRGTLGLIWGNRTIAIYLAALPPDPQFTLFVALYQFPMYFTALLFGRARR